MAGIQHSEAPVTTAAKPRQETRPKEGPKPRQLPQYNVVLLDDDYHTYKYVIEMLGALFGHPFAKAYQMAREVDTTGRVIVLTTSREHAELKRDQIHAYGPDRRIPRCRGSMSAIIEPVET